ncbi:MAG: hypothetical protein PHQ14_12375, partial [Chromatiales bacterium]|nr:hypothetical protein [Chromatiales bacterium]
MPAPDAFPTMRPVPAAAGADSEPALAADTNEEKPHAIEHGRDAGNVRRITLADTDDGTLQPHDPEAL